MIPTHQNTVQPDKPQSTKMRIKFPGIHLPVVTIVNILMSAFQISLQVDLPWQMHSFIHSFTHASSETWKWPLRSGLSQNIIGSAGQVRIFFFLNLK